MPFLQCRVARHRLTTFFKIMSIDFCLIFQILKRFSIIILTGMHVEKIAVFSVL